MTNNNLCFYENNGKTKQITLLLKEKNKMTKIKPHNKILELLFGNGKGETKLPNCPFCGNEAETDYTGQATCRNCLATASIKVWKQRVKK